MKLTREKLKQIIREELQEAQESPGELAALKAMAGAPYTPDVSTNAGDAIENLIKKIGLTEDNKEAQLLRLAGRLVDAKEDENKQLYIGMIKNLINDMSVKKPNLPVQERKKNK